MTTVTMLIFSGRPDPSWELRDEEASALRRRLGSGHGISYPEVPVLGYRGFLVRSTDPGLPPELVVRGLPDVERFLLSTAQGRVPAEVIGMIEGEITRRQRSDDGSA